METTLDTLLHPRSVDEVPWRHLPLVLALAFALRAAIALWGDFVLHPDEIMQYLEPAHRLVFGNGVAYWEYHYGARSWLVPGLVAGVLKLFDAVGLGQPLWYVAGVKLTFCAISLAIPAGMYFFARRHFSETAARLALVAGAFWYELAGFAHKPMTEFVATALLVALLALCVHPAASRHRVVWSVALLAVMGVAIRLQYAPVALVLLVIFFVRTSRKMPLVAATGGLLLGVGILDAIAWDGSLFHSYVTNLRFNLLLGEMRTDESPVWQYLPWLLIASAGFGALFLVTASFQARRYGLLLGLIVLVLVAHSLQPHKEYRFAFAVVPLWLLIGADLMARVTAPGKRARSLVGLATAVFAVASLAGVLNLLPYQDRLYQAWSRETGAVGFLRKQDPIFDAYRYLAQAPGVTAVWQVDRHYYNLPGYYYLHHEIPFYDAFTGSSVLRGRTPLTAYVSHVVSTQPDLAVPGYTLDRAFGDVRILRRDAERIAPIRAWRSYTPTVVDDFTAGIMRRIDPEAPSPPSRSGIRLANPDS